MKLYLARRSLVGWWWHGGFELSARIVASPKATVELKIHDLGRRELYVSPVAIDFECRAESAFDRARELDGERDHKQRAKAMQLNLEGLSLLRKAAREARATVGELLGAGKTFRAMTASECAATEAGLRRGFEHLVREMSTIEKYDRELEDLTDPAASADVVPPHEWDTLKGD